MREVSPTSVDLPSKEQEPEGIPHASKERQGEKVPVEPTSSLSTQNSQQLLVNSERIRENKPVGLLECPLCRSVGKPMFFATQQDLQGHIKAVHTGYPDYVR
ncbi:MAG: hypothetical protein ACPLRY_08560 [Candidatus Bathyarchaeales archaeon]